MTSTAGGCFKEPGACLLPVLHHLSYTISPLDIVFTTLMSAMSGTGVANGFASRMATSASIPTFNIPFRSSRKPIFAAFTVKSSSASYKLILSDSTGC